MVVQLTRVDEFNGKVDIDNFIISSNILSKPDVLKNALNSLTEDGFLLSIENKSYDLNEDDVNSINCKLITKYYFNTGICLLIRKVISLIGEVC